MPKITSLDHFTVVCRDLDESVRFYTEVLGATIERPKRVSSTPESPSGLSPVGVMMGSIRVDLFQADERWQPYPGTYAQHYAFPIEWEAVDEWFAHMKSHGVNLEIHPAGDRTVSLYFTDPTGYHMELNLRSTDPQFVRDECTRLIQKFGTTYHWADGTGLPEGQPQGVWTTAPAR